METQTMKLKRFGDWLYIQNKTFEGGELKEGFIKGVKLRSNKKEQTAQELLDEEILNDPSNPSYWKAVKPLKESSYNQYYYSKYGGIALR